MGVGEWGKSNSKTEILPRKILIKKSILTDSGQKNLCPRRKKIVPYMYAVCHASRTMTDVSKLIPCKNKHSLVASQVPDSSPTVGTLSIRRTNLTWPKRLLLHFVHDFVGCFAFVDADSETSFNRRCCLIEMQWAPDDSVPKLDELSV